MASTNVAQFAAELKMPAGVLLEQLNAAGILKKDASEALSETDKARLLAHLRRAHGNAGAEKRKITLTRKQTSEIRQAMQPVKRAQFRSKCARSAFLSNLNIPRLSCWIKRKAPPAQQPAIR